jgi:hypothetical protein
VHERSASKQAQKGHVMYQLLATAGGVTVAEATGAYDISPGLKIKLYELAEQKPALRAATSNSDLAEWDLELREVYLSIADDIEHPRPIDMRNTDGEELEFHSIHYDIESPEAAFSGLRHLAIGMSREDLEALVKRGAGGMIRSVEFPWLRPSENAYEDDGLTALGRVYIEPTVMRIEVNSAPRAKRIMDIVADSLGKGAVYRSTQKQTLAEAKAKNQRGPGRKAGGTRKPDASPDSPEVQQQMDEILARHYERWTDQALPALGGKTPRASMADPIGREKVRALVEQIETGPPSNVSTDAYRRTMQQLRAALGLAADSSR